MNNINNIQTIKALYAEIKVKDRPAFHELVASEFGVSITTVKTGWFSRFNILSEYKVRENLISFMQNYIANKNNVAV